MEQVQGTPAQASQQAVAPDQPAVATPAATQPPESQSHKFAELAKQERAMQKMRNDLKTSQAQIEQERAKYQTFEQTKANARLNPLEYLKAAGLTPDDLAQFQLNEGNPTADLQARQALARVEQLERELKERDERTTKQTQEQSQRAAQEAMENFRIETRSFVESNPDEFELINKWEAHDYVTGTIEEHWRQGVERWERSGREDSLKPKILSKEEAAKLTEQWLEGLFEKGISSKKYGARYKRIEEAPQDPTPKEGGFQKTVQTPVQAPKTLHNGLTSGVSLGTQAGKSMEQKMAEALKRLNASKNS